VGTVEETLCPHCGEYQKNLHKRLKALFVGRRFLCSVCKGPVVVKELTKGPRTLFRRIVLETES
jgi:hypothetical protein